MLTVHLRINDAATGKPTPVRVRVSAPDGTQFAPLGRFVEMPLGRNEAVGGGLVVGRERWFYTDGSCEIPLPAGVPLRVQATKGPEYTPLDQTVTLGAGQMALRYTLERWADARADGWVSVDTRCHFLSPHDALLEAAGEGLDVVNLLAVEQRYPCHDGTAYLTVPNLAAFSGQTPALERDGTSVVVNTLNTHPVLGKVGLLHSHRPVFPLSFGDDEGTDDWGISDWCDQCHRKNGLTVWVDAFEPSGGVIGEALVAAILGKIDAIEMTAGPRKVPLLPWVYRLWDAGFLVPCVGASGKDGNKVALGSVRTYAKAEPNPPAPFPGREGGETPAPSSSPSPPAGPREASLTGPASGPGGGRGEGSWVEAVRAGRTFATAGPLLGYEKSGDRVRATARSPVPFGKLELVANNHVTAVAECEAADGGFRAELEGVVPDAGWFAVRCRGTNAFAHTSPVALDKPARDPDSAALAKLIDQVREWAEARGRYTNPKRKEQLLARCAEAAAKLGVAP